MSKSDSHCAQVLRALLIDGKVDTALPADCQRSDVEHALGGRGEEGQGQLSGVWRTQVKYPLGERQVRVFYTPEGSLLLLDAEDPRCSGDLETLLASFGTPEATLPARKGVMGYAGLEQVYASRGRTLVIGTPLDDTAGGRKLLRVLAYAPTTVADYETRLGGRDPWIIRRPGP